MSMRAAHLALAALAAVASLAHADDHSRKPVMISDGICDAFMLSALTPLPEDATTYLFFTGILGQAVAAPLIHGAANDWDRAGIDLANRVSLPLLGVWIVDQFCGSSLSCLTPSIIGGVTGVAIAQVIDWLLISQPTQDAAATPRMLSFGGRF